MNKEIEELLKNIKKQVIIDEKLGKEIAQDFHKTTLNYKEIKLLLSYTEQLEKKIDQYENPDDLTLFYMWLDTKAKDKIKQLEKRNKELKDGWQQEIYDKNEVLNDWLEAQRKINVLENNRDKAIEILERHTRYSTEELLNILKGDSE